MPGLGGTTERPRREETSIATIDKIQSLETPAFQAMAGEISAYVATRQPPAWMDVKDLPKLPSGLSGEELALFKNKMKVRQLTEVVRKHRTLTGGHYRIDYTKVREDHRTLLERFGIKKKNVPAVSDFIVTFARQKLRHEAIDVNIDHHMGKKTKEDRQAALAILRGLSGEAAKAGKKSIDQVQRGYLDSIKKGYMERTGKEMTQQQLTDMCRAALQAGFSVKAVSAFVKPLIKTPKGPKREEEGPGTTESTIMLTALQKMARETAFRLTDQLRRASREYEVDKDNSETRERFEAAKARLMEFTGSKGTVDDLIKLRDAEEDVIKKAVYGFVGAKIALNTGNLKVRPKLRQANA